MISFTNVGKKLGEFELREITFELPKGCICGLVGRNGAGKTTILNLLLGLLKPDSGKVEIDGLNYRDDEKKIRNLLGSVLVDELFLPYLSGEKNGEYFGGFYEAFSMEEYKDYLMKFQIDGKKQFRKLSKGQKLKCQFAFALSVHPKYLILDEPTANFDTDFRTEFWRLIQEFVSNEENTVILATQLTDDLDRVADYLIYVDEGYIVFNGDMEFFRDEYRSVTGESQLMDEIDPNYVIHIEDGVYSSKGLIFSGAYLPDGIVEAPITIEEFMYHMSKGDGRDA